jgi:hypothetical protein
MYLVLLLIGRVIRDLMDSELCYLPMLLYLCLLHSLAQIISYLVFVLVMLPIMSLMDSGLSCLQDLPDL